MMMISSVPSPMYISDPPFRAQTAGKSSDYPGRPVRKRRPACMREWALLGSNQRPPLVEPCGHLPMRARGRNSSVVPHDFAQLGVGAFAYLRGPCCHRVATSPGLAPELRSR
jgi:hypothetical protein